MLAKDPNARLSMKDVRATFAEYYDKIVKNPVHQVQFQRIKEIEEQAKQAENKRLEIAKNIIMLNAKKAAFLQDLRRDSNFADVPGKFYNDLTMQLSLLHVHDDAAVKKFKHDFLQASPLYKPYRETLPFIHAKTNILDAKENLIQRVENLLSRLYVVTHVMHALKV